MAKHSLFYDFKEIEKKSCNFNFIQSDRGVGKTVGAIKKAIDDYLDKGIKSIWVRRYKTNIKNAGKGCVYGFFNGFIDAYINNPLADIKLKVKYNQLKLTTKNSVKGYLTKDGKEEDFIFFVPLSQQENMKGNSYLEYGNIFYDEFQKEKSNTPYLQNEHNQLINLYITVDRNRDTTKLYAMANAVTINNPHYAYIGVKNFNTRFWYKKGKNGNNLYVVENYINKGYRGMVKESNLGEALKGTKFGAYVLDSEYLQDNDIFVQKRSGRCLYMFTIAVNSRRFGVWLNEEIGLIFIDDKIEPNYPITYSLSSDTYGLNMYALRYAKNKYDFNKLVYMVKHNLVRFDNTSIKDAVYMILLKCV